MWARGGGLGRILFRKMSVCDFICVCVCAWLDKLWIKATNQCLILQSSLLLLCQNYPCTSLQMYPQFACCSGSYLASLLLGLPCVFLLGLSCIVTAWFKWCIFIGVTLYYYRLGLACVFLLGVALYCYCLDYLMCFNLCCPCVFGCCWHCFACCLGSNWCMCGVTSVCDCWVTGVSVGLLCMWVLGYWCIDCWVTVYVSVGLRCVSVGLLCECWLRCLSVGLLCV